MKKTWTESIRFLLIIFLFQPFSLFSQNQKLDSIENRIREYKKRDTIKVNLLNESAYALCKIDLEKTFKYVNEARVLSDELSYNKGKAESFRIQAIYFDYKSNYSEALKYYKQSLNLNRQIGNKLGIMKSLRSLGFFYFYRGNINKSNENCLEALKLAEEIGDKNELAITYNNLGLNYRHSGDFSNALKFCKKAIKINKEIGNQYQLGLNYLNLSMIYSFTEDTTKSLEYLKKSLKIFRKKEDKLNEALSLRLIGNQLVTLSKYYDAFAALEESIELGNDLKIEYVVYLNYFELGRLYSFLEDIPKSLEYYNKALDYYISIEDKSGEIWVRNGIGSVYEFQKKYSEALFHYKKAFQLNKETGNQREIAWSKTLIATLLIKTNEYSSAKQYLDEVSLVNNEIGDKNINHYLFIGLSKIYNYNNEKQKAYDFAKLAYTNDKQQKKIQFLSQSSKLLSEVSVSLGLFKEAYTYQDIYKTASDSVNSIEEIKKIAKIDHQKEIEKEKALAAQEKLRIETITTEKIKRNLIIRNASIVGIIALLIILIVIYRNYQLKIRANKKLKKQKSKIQTQAKELDIKNSNLLSLNATKNKFFSIISHDLKNPFNTLLGLSDMLLDSDNKFTKEERLEYIGYINDCSKNTYKLLENLLTWSKSNSGLISFTPEDINLSTIVEDIGLMFKEILDSKQIVLQIEIDNEMVVHADRNMFQAIIRNLLSNAIKFSYRGGKIKISGKSDYLNKGQLCSIIEVSDHGVGITRESQEKIFDISQHSNTKGTEEESGTGLGLILCKEFVEKHRGDIWFESKEKSTSFYFTISKEKVEKEHILISEIS